MIPGITASKWNLTNKMSMHTEPNNRWPPAAGFCPNRTTGPVSQHSGHLQRTVRGIAWLLAWATLHPLPVSAESISVYTANIVGVQRLALPAANRFRLAAAPFESEHNTLQELLAPQQMIAATTAAGADRIRFWDTQEQTYRSAALHPNGNYYLLNASGQFDGGWVVVNEWVVTPGTGFWIVTAPTSPDNRSVLVAGDVSTRADIELPITQGYQILTYPFAVEQPLGQTQLMASGATAATTAAGADRVRIWNPDQQRYEGYALHSNGTWYQLTPSGQFDSDWIESTHTFQPGEAFFYWAQHDFTWTEPNPITTMDEP